MSSTPTSPSWPDTVSRLMRVPAPPGSPAKVGSPHPPGTLWRAALAQAIHADLAAGVCRGRRVVPLAYPGLSGLLLYEYPPCVRVLVDTKSGEEGEEGEVVETPVDVRTVFGDAESGARGLSVEEMLELVQARMVYTPAHACTSFAAGQAMQAYVTSPAYAPIAATHGILIDAGATDRVGRLSFIASCSGEIDNDATSSETDTDIPPYEVYTDTPSLEMYIDTLSPGMTTAPSFLEMDVDTHDAAATPASRGRTPTPEDLPRSTSTPASVSSAGSLGPATPPPAQPSFDIRLQSASPRVLVHSASPSPSPRVLGPSRVRNVLHKNVDLTHKNVDLTHKTLDLTHKTLDPTHKTLDLASDFELDPDFGREALACSTPLASCVFSAADSDRSGDGGDACAQFNDVQFDDTKESGQLHDDDESSQFEDADENAMPEDAGDGHIGDETVWYDAEEGDMDLCADEGEVEALLALDDGVHMAKRSALVAVA